MKEVQMDMMNGYILIQDIKNEIITKSGLYVPETDNNRFSRVVKTFPNSVLNVGDVIIKPLGRTTPIRLTVKEENGEIHEEIFDCIREGFVFAKIIDD